MATRNRYAEIMAQYQQAQPFSFFGYPKAYTGGYDIAQPQVSAPVNRYEEIMAQPARAGGGQGLPIDYNPEWTAKTDAEKAAYYAEHPGWAKFTQLGQNVFGFTWPGMLQSKLAPDFVARQKLIAQGINPDDGSGDPTAGRYLGYTDAYGSDPSASFGFVQAPGENRGGFIPVTPQQTPTTQTQNFNVIDPTNAIESAFPSGTHYTDKWFTRDAFGRLVNPNAPLAGGSSSSANVSLLAQNALAGSSMQSALNSLAQSQAEAQQRAIFNAIQNVQFEGMDRWSVPTALLSPIPVGNITPVQDSQPSTSNEGRGGGRDGEGGEGGGYSNANAGNYGWTRSGGGEGGGWAQGGHVAMQHLLGPNPEGPDDGYGALKDGEFVINDKAVKKYGIELMQAINSGKISKGKLRGLLEM